MNDETTTQEERRLDRIITQKEVEIERLQRVITNAMDALSNGRTEDGARILRECFWLGREKIGA